MWNLVDLTLAGVILGAICTMAERVRPAHAVAYRDVIGRDIVAFVVYIGAVTPGALWFSGRVDAALGLAQHLVGWPLAVRIAGFYLLADLGSYLLHRLMHTRALWRIHRWHHAPSYLYWFAGVRATLPQQFLFNLPVVAAWPLLGDVPAWLPMVFAIEGIARNDWMHVNVTWRSRWLEWILVTPRYHHIHHSRDHEGNYGSLFTIWDRLFGTRIDPDSITAPLRFGITERAHPLRLVVGV